MADIKRDLSIKIAHDLRGRAYVDLDIDEPDGHAWLTRDEAQVIAHGLRAALAELDRLDSIAEGQGDG